jgi:hypothetical protein
LEIVFTAYSRPVARSTARCTTPKLPAPSMSPTSYLTTPSRDRGSRNLPSEPPPPFAPYHHVIMTYMRKERAPVISNDAGANQVTREGRIRPCAEVTFVVKHICNRLCWQSLHWLRLKNALSGANAASAKLIHTYHPMHCTHSARAVGVVKRSMHKSDTLLTMTI